jgi:UDP:flavonoid glycosyltransferase YjiC (YdhE family)
MGRDQEDTAARVTLSGSGVRLKASASAKAIASATETVLEGDRYRTAAQALATAIAAETKTDRAIEELENLAASKTQRPKMHEQTAPAVR